MACACVLACFILLARGAAEQSTPQTCSVQPGEGDHDLVGMLQLSKKVQMGPQIPPNPRRVSRTYVSTDPIASAAFFRKYFAATPIPARNCSTAVQVPLINGNYIVYSFFEDAAMPDNVDMEGLIAAKESSLTAMFAKEQLSSMWVDNHDGIQPASFDLARASQDGVQMGVFGLGHAIVRVSIPHTLWTLEVGPVMDTGNLTQYDTEAESCRQLLDPDVKRTNFLSPWYKTSLMSYDPSRSADWMVKVMGVQAEKSPLRPIEGCPLAGWVMQMGPGGKKFRFHAVRAAVAGAREESLLRAIEAAREMDASKFDRLMLNSFVIPVPSLDPYIQKLKSHSFTFLLTSTGDSEYVLFANLPGTISTVQFRSEHVSLAEPIRLSLNQCLLQF